MSDFLKTAYQLGAEAALEKFAFAPAPGLMGTMASMGQRALGFAKQQAPKALAMAQQHAPQATAFAQKHAPAVQAFAQRHKTPLMLGGAAAAGMAAGSLLNDGQ